MLHVCIIRANKDPKEYYLLLNPKDHSVCGSDSVAQGLAYWMRQYEKRFLGVEAQGGVCLAMIQFTPCVVSFRNLKQLEKRLFSKVTPADSHVFDVRGESLFFTGLGLDPEDAEAAFQKGKIPSL